MWADVHLMSSCSKKTLHALKEVYGYYLNPYEVQEDKLDNDPFDEWPTLHFEEVEVSEEESLEEEINGAEAE